MIELLIIAVIIIIALAIYLASARQDAAEWKHQCEATLTKWLDAEDRADRAEFKLRDYLRRERHVGFVYEMALDDLQNHPRPSDHHWNWN